MRILITSFALLHFSIINLYAQEIDVLADVFGTLPEISNVRISPDGSKLLMFHNVDGQVILVTRSLEDLSAPMNGMPNDEGDYSWAEWLSNENIIAGMEFTQVSNSRGRFGTVTRLVTVDWKGENGSDAANPKRRLWDLRVVDLLKDDPEHILIQIVGTGNNTRGYKRDVYKLNVITKKMEIYHQGIRALKRWKTDKNHNVRMGQGFSSGFYARSGRDLAHYRKDENSPWIELYDYDIKYGRGYTKEDWEKAPYNFEGFTPNPSEIYVSKMNQYGKRALYKFNVDTKEFVEEVVSDEHYDINNFWFDDDHNLEGYSYDGERSKTVRVSELGKRLDRIFTKTFPNALVSIASRTDAEDKFILYVTSPTEPGTFYYFDLNEGKIEMLGYNYQKVDVENLSEMNPVSYKARDGLTIPGYLSLPQNAEPNKKLPTIIMPHGGPLARDRWEFNYWVQFLTMQGYAVLQMNFRGSTGYGDDFMKLGFHEWGRKMLEDINDGAKWMIEEGYADPDKMCIVGASYGGYAALQGVVKDPSLYKCSVAFAPVTNMSREFRYVITTYVESKDWSYDEASPSKNIDKINVPVLLFHGDLDRNVSVKQTRFFESAMRSAGKDIKYIEFKDEDHYLHNQEHRITFLKELGYFLEMHLKH